MEELLKKLTMADLPESQREIAEVIGLESYLKLAKWVSGDTIYISKQDELLRCMRNAEIRKRFNGYNYSALAKEYNLTTRAVRTIIGETQATYVVDGQISIFDK